MIKLYKKGLCLRQVGNRFNISPNRVSRILKANGVERRNHADGTRLLHEHLNVDPPTNFPWHLKNVFSKLVAVFLLTDGYMKKGGGIMLICTDETLQRYFLTLLKENSGLAPTTNSYMKKGKETIVNSTLVASELLKLSSSYNTYPRNCSYEEYYRRPQPSLSFLENEDLNLLREVVRIAMSTDGTVLVDFSCNSIHPRLEFCCAHPILLYEWKEVFEKVGLKSYILKSKFTWSKYKGLGIKRLESIRRFIEIGGFINDVKITGKSKYYKGIAKNELLNLVFFMNKNSFHFSKEESIKEKHNILRKMLVDPIKREKWLKRGIEYLKIEKKIKWERTRHNVLNFVRNEVSASRYPTHKILRAKFKINVQHYFKGGVHEIYRLAKVKTRREFLQDKIIDFVKESAKNGHYPTGEEIDSIYHTNFRQFFTSIVALYERADVIYPRFVKRVPKKPFKTKERGREAIKKYLLKKTTEGVYPSGDQIENDVRVKLSTYFHGINEAYEYANIDKNH